MKKLNYTGSSKLKSRIAYLLNRKAPLPLDGNGDPDWGSNGQVLSTDGNGNTTWVNQGGGGSGGHTIWNRIKSALTQRSRLWFADANASDASADDATKVEVVTELLNETAFDNLATDGTADGIYTFPDSGGEYLTAEMVGYENTNVKTALDGKVSKSGDTMTGRLNIASTGSNDWYPLLLKSNFANACYIRLYDKNNTELGAFGCNEANVPYFRDGNGVLHVLSMRKVTTLVNESVNLAQSGTKTYATLTLTYLSQFDEVTFLCNWGSPVGALVMTKAMISKTATVYGNSGAVGISSGSHYGSFTFGSSGMTVRNGSSSTMVTLLVEGITY